MIEELENNINTEISILDEIKTYQSRVDFSSGPTKKLLINTIAALESSLKILNNSMGEVVKEIPEYKTLPSQEKKIKRPLEKVKMVRSKGDVEVVINKKNREKFLEQLSISEDYIKKLKKRQSEEEEVYEDFKAARGYLRLSNKLFLKRASAMIRAGKFKKLHEDLKKSNLNILLEAYVSLILTSVFFSFFIALFLVVLSGFLDFSFSFPFVTFQTGSYFFGLIKSLWLIAVIPALVFASVYFYPSLEKRSIEKKIDMELPFAVIHMSAISGSGISPVEIFKIIGLGKEYKALRKEIRKVLNQINLYGYDLVSALNNAAKNSPSEKLSELYSGLGTTIHSGGDLKEFFEKRSETLLLSYRLEREKYSKMAETFMDIYISVVIAAPMVLMLLLVIMSVSNIGVQFTQLQFTILIVGIVSIINVLFLIFLHLKQPTY